MTYDEWRIEVSFLLDQSGMSDYYGDTLKLYHFEGKTPQETVEWLKKISEVRE